MNDKKLRLILGVGRSGTTWLMQVLSKTSTPIRSILEPLPSIRRYAVNLPDEIKNHQLYKNNYEECSEFSNNSPVLTAYRSCLNPKIKNGKWLLRNDKNWEYLLIKEVNCLLSAEALINYFKDHIKIIFIVRDPIYIMDSLFSNQGWNHGIKVYLKREAEFYEIEAPDNVINTRYRKLAKKILIVNKIHDQFYTLRNLYKDIIHIVTYEEMCKDPFNKFKQLSNFFNFKYDKSIEEFLSKTLIEDPNFRKDKSSVFKNTFAQINRPYKFFNEEDINFCKNFIVNK